MRILQAQWFSRKALPWRACSAFCFVQLSCFTAGLPAIAGDAEDFFTHIHTDKVMADVTVSPGSAGPVEITIRLETAEERPLAAKAVSVELSNMQSGIGPQTVQAVHTRDDLWLIKAPMLAAGRWTLGLGISIFDADTIIVRAPILIR